LSAGKELSRPPGGRQQAGANAKDTDMQFLMLLISEEEGWGAMEATEQEDWLDRYRQFDEDLRSAGALVSANHLAPAAHSRTVRVHDTRKVVQDGPFAETKEQVLGYFLIEAATMDEAVDWAARCPGSHHGAVEVRPIGTPPL